MGQPLGYREQTVAPTGKDYGHLRVSCCIAIATRFHGLPVSYATPGERFPERILSGVLACESVLCAHRSARALPKEFGAPPIPAFFSAVPDFVLHERKVQIRFAGELSSSGRLTWPTSTLRFGRRRTLGALIIATKPRVITVHATPC